jgi:uncharacterized repeat protein (TIGR03803 family)
MLRRTERTPMLTCAALLIGCAFAGSALAKGFRVIHAFSPYNDDGMTPTAGLTADSAGTLYGTTSFGGSTGFGTVFKIDGTDAESVIHSFGSGTDGSEPECVPVIDSSGNIFGTTQAGGTYGDGTVFELTSDGGENVIYFDASNGAQPLGGLIMDSSGNLYGTTSEGGTYGHGTVFEVLAAWGSIDTLYSFTGQNDGSNPAAALLIDAGGDLYGTTEYGGSYGAGTVFELSKNGQESVLYSFTGGSDGANPVAHLTRDSAGHLYSTTMQGGAVGSGTVFKLTESGKETVLSSLGNYYGNYPYGGVILDRKGDLYGTTQTGGSGGCSGDCGVVFKLATDGTETVLHSFTDGRDGAYPESDLTAGKNGRFYGTASAGGKYGYGTVFEIRK